MRAPALARAGAETRGYIESDVGGFGVGCGGVVTLRRELRLQITRFVIAIRRMRARAISLRRGGEKRKREKKVRVGGGGGEGKGETRTNTRRVQSYTCMCVYTRVMVDL